jgi:hypothetical protein
VFRNKTIIHGLSWLFHPTDHVDRKARAYKVIKHPKTWQVCATSYYKQLFQIGFEALLHQNLSFHFFSAKSVCFCEAVTRHEGQHDTTAIFLVSRPHRMAYYGIWPFISNGGYNFFLTLWHFYSNFNYRYHRKWS